jgi:hypothetical protein
VAKQIGIAPTYIYRVLGQLVEAGKVVKEGRNFRAV